MIGVAIKNSKDLRKSELKRTFVSAFGAANLKFGQEKRRKIVKSFKRKNCCKTNGDRELTIIELINKFLKLTIADQLGKCSCCFKGDTNDSSDNVNQLLLEGESPHKEDPKEAAEPPVSIQVINEKLKLVQIEEQEASENSINRISAKPYYQNSCQQRVQTSSSLRKVAADDSKSKECPTLELERRYGFRHVGLKIMRLMGWKGGCLGRNDQGIMEPIRPVSQCSKKGFGFIEKLKPMKNNPSKGKSHSTGIVRTNYPPCRIFLQRKERIEQKANNSTEYSHSSTVQHTETVRKNYPPSRIFQERKQRIKQIGNNSTEFSHSSTVQHTEIVRKNYSPSRIFQERKQHIKQMVNNSTEFSYSATVQHSKIKRNNYPPSRIFQERQQRTKQKANNTTEFSHSATVQHTEIRQNNYPPSRIFQQRKQHIQQQANINTWFSHIPTLHVSYSWYLVLNPYYFPLR